MLDYSFATTIPTLMVAATAVIFAYLATMALTRH
jgi:hypothetical protein